jgi:outer membrane protein assembly factor BamA
MAIRRSRSISACSIAGDNRVRLIIALALALRALAGPSAFAQAPAAHIGERIVDVQLVREGRPLDDPAVSALVETRIGQPLLMAQVRESILHIFGLGRFQDVQVEALGAPGGVLLRYNVVPLHNVERIDFRGHPALGLSEGMLRGAVTSRFGSSPAVGRAQDAARAIEQLYHDHGYLRATAAVVATERHDPDRTLL